MTQAIADGTRQHVDLSLRLGEFGQELLLGVARSGGGTSDDGRLLRQPHLEEEGDENTAETADQNGSGSIHGWLDGAMSAFLPEESL